VLVAEPDYRVQVFATPNDRAYTSQWHHPKIASPAAWDTTTGSDRVRASPPPALPLAASPLPALPPRALSHRCHPPLTAYPPQVKVCIIDSGLRIDHPDLAANVVKGWNVIPVEESDPYPLPGDPVWLNYNDTLGHGTHVAGLVGAVSNNNRGVAGVAWRAALMPCRFIGDSGAGYVSDAITCMRLCRAEGAHVYSNSWGGVPYSRVLSNEIRDLADDGGLFVAAAGNAGRDLDSIPDSAYPAAYPLANQLTVAATTSQNVLAGFSNYNRDLVHLAAPGEQILSTTHDGGYGSMSGTSMATPIVSGAVALLQSMALAVGPALSPAAVRSLLMSTVDPMAGGSSTVVSGGRLNVAKAVDKLKLQLSGGQWPLGDSTPSTPAPAPAPLPQVPASPPVAAPPPPPGPGAHVVPQCGASALRGCAAVQSSTAGARAAGNAVNGDCRTNVTALEAACASTDPAQSNPWWAGTLTAQGSVAAVSITTRTDCCWDSIIGAQVLVGNGSWAGPGQASGGRFAECAQVSAASVARGQRIALTCSRALVGDTVAVYLPKLKTALTLCEVDVALGAASSSELAPAGPPCPLPARRSRALLMC
jgi:hypothetical protein